MVADVFGGKKSAKECSLEGLNLKVLEEYQSWHSEDGECSLKAVRYTQLGRLLSSWLSAGFHSMC